MLPWHCAYPLLSFFHPALTSSVVDFIFLAGLGAVFTGARAYSSVSCVVHHTSQIAGAGPHQGDGNEAVCANQTGVRMDFFFFITTKLMFPMLIV